ncbi:hypothetical protein [Halomonas sp. MES3-P3E]|nr:hypothetical protein [Halomonas sp. MES3-P3E]
MTVQTVTPKRPFRGKPRGRELDPIRLEVTRLINGGTALKIVKHRRVAI